MGAEGPRIALTLGDPAGIGPEVLLKALADPHLQGQASITVVGPQKCLELTYERLQSCSLADPADLTLIEVGSEAGIELGQGSSASGTVSFASLERAIKGALAGEFEAIVTSPISKQAWQAAGHNYPGQTELLAERCALEKFAMAFVARSPHTGWTLRTVLATTHIPLAEVPRTLSPTLLTGKLDLLVNSLEQDFGLSSPEITIAGLNPHAGEGGHLGREEQDWMIAWLARQQERHPQVKLTGPLPPDTLWVKPGQAWYRPDQRGADAYLALYHDQGLIPLKMLAFDCAVNMTLGLPFIRTSPDHGTAFDIAGQGVADCGSLKAALKLACSLAARRRVTS